MLIMVSNLKMKNIQEALAWKLTAPSPRSGLRPSSRSSRPSLSPALPRHSRSRTSSGLSHRYELARPLSRLVLTITVLEDMGYHHLSHDSAKRAQEAPPARIHRRVPAGYRDRVCRDPRHPDLGRTPAHRSARRVCDVDGRGLEGHDRTCRRRSSHRVPAEGDPHAYRDGYEVRLGHRERCQGKLGGGRRGRREGLRIVIDTRRHRG